MLRVRSPKKQLHHGLHFAFLVKSHRNVIRGFVRILRLYPLKLAKVALDLQVKLLQQVDHPFIIKFVDSFVDPEGKMYIIMEYADGMCRVGRCHKFLP